MLDSWDEVGGGGGGKNQWKQSPHTIEFVVNCTKDKKKKNYTEVKQPYSLCEWRKEKSYFDWSGVI